MEALRLHNIKRLFNTISAALCTIVMYWLINLELVHLPVLLYDFVTLHIELFNTILGGINFLIYILIKKRHRPKNVMLYYLSVMSWNLLAIRLVWWQEGLVWEGLFIEYALLILGVLFGIYFIIMRYLNYRGKRGYTKHGM